MFNNNCNNRCCFDPCECQPEPCCCIGATGPTGPAGGFAPAYGTFISNQARIIDTAWRSSPYQAHPYLYTAFRRPRPGRLLPALCRSHNSTA